MNYRQPAHRTIQPLDEMDRAKLRKQAQLIYVSIALLGVALFFAYVGVNLARTGEWTGVAVIAVVCTVLAVLARLVWRSGGVVHRDLRAGQKERFATQVDGKRVRSHGPDSRATYLLRFGDREDAVTEAEYRAFSPGDRVFVERAQHSRLLLYVRPLAEAADAAQLEQRKNGD